MFQVCNVYQQWGGTQPGCLPVLPSHLLQGFSAHHGGSRAQGLDRQGLCHLAGPGDGWVHWLTHGMTWCTTLIAFHFHISFQPRVDFYVANNVSFFFWWGGRIQVTMWNVKLERRRRFCASCRTSSWSPSQSPAALPFGQTTANHRAPCLWSVTWRQCRTWTQLVIQAWFLALPFPPPPWSPSHHLALFHVKSMILCLELRNCWVTQTPHRIAPGTFLGSSRTQPAGLWTGALRCVSCVGSMWAVEEEQQISKTIWPTSTTSDHVTVTGTGQ